ncbi:nucleotidyltransferase family protein [Aestuariispira ectoiniformans]|uniref:nucleotidyltransferase family protein n=1 Tax=Aestuariispira ectoiniformans TaxID=2775080 RepID=UPI00223B1ADC|nr:nucleotidyltransferase family protein [Aestuariispira ectoiniformans]
MEHTEQLRDLVMADPWRVRCLSVLRDVMPDVWIGAGFVRNLVWDWLGGPIRLPLDDVDIVYFDRQDIDEATEKTFETVLRNAAPDIPWSVKNQARMHLKHGDDPYRDLVDGLGHWLETATTVSVRFDGQNQMEILGPYGLQDLMAGILRPTASGYQRLGHLRRRAEDKGWLRRWPHVKFLSDDPAMSLSPFKVKVPL